MYSPDLLFFISDPQLVVLPFTSCLKQKTTTDGTTTNETTKVAKKSQFVTVLLDNCKAVKKMGASLTYGCERCSFGYSGILVRNYQDEGWMFDQCQPVAACKTTTYKPGLGGIDT